MIRSVAVSLLCALAASTIPATAVADRKAPVERDDPATASAKKHFERGEKLYALAKFDEALDEYQKAFDARPIPDFLFNIGQCYRNLGDYDSAIFSYKKFLKLEPEAPNRAKVENLIDELEQKKALGDTQRLGLEKKKEPPPPPPAEESRPFYKKWWFWTGVAVVGIGGGVGIYEGTKGSSAPPTALGNIVFGK